MKLELVAIIGVVGIDIGQFATVSSSWHRGVAEIVAVLGAL